MTQSREQWLKRSARACVESDSLPIWCKAIWILVCRWCINRRFMQSAATVIRTDDGCLLAGTPDECELNQVVFYRGVFEPVLSEVIKRTVHEGDVCVDAGANVGYFTLLMAKKAGATGKVFAIEAAPGNIDRLQANVEMNSYQARVEVVHAACGHDRGDVTFYVHRKNDMWCRLVLPEPSELDYWLMGRNNWQPTTVRADRLSALVGHHAPNVSFLKIDIEGSERHMARDVLQHFTHARLCIALEAKAPFIRDVLGPFEEAGFLAYDLHNDYRWLIDHRVRPIRRTPYSSLYDRKHLTDVLLTRREISPE